MSNTKEKILLIDGHSILNRAFYGVPDLTNAEGLHTNAVYGFLNILFKTLQEEDPQYLAVALDEAAPTFRHKMYEAYKGTRHAMPQELKEQVPLLREVLTAMGILQLSKPGFEADDLLGTVAVRAEADGHDVTIVSGDRDLLQLATEKILIRIPKTRGGVTETKNYHAADVVEEYGLTPPQIIELKALMGDSSDNIPGLPGVGIKTATKILEAYGTIEEAHAHLEEITPNKAREAMREHWDDAVLSKTLATIDTAAPVEADTEQMRIGNFYTPEAVRLFKRLEFRKLLAQAELPAEERALPAPTVITDLSEAETLFTRVARGERVGISALAEKNKDGSATLSGVGISFSAAERFYLPAEGFLTADYLGGRLEEAAKTAGCLATWQMKTLYQCLPVSGEGNWFDVHLAAYLLNPLSSNYPYDGIAEEYAGLSVPSEEERFGDKKKQKKEGRSDEDQAAYAADIALASCESARPLREALQNTGMETLYDEMEFPLIRVLYKMERDGIRLLPDRLQAYAAQLQEGITKLEETIYEEAGETFNIQSPKQLGEILFDRMGLPGGKKTKTGYSTAADVLEKLAPSVPLVARVLEYRQLTKLKSTYADALAGFLAEDGRIHSTFHQTITATGRLSSADPNLQNIPVRMELGRQIRKVFVPAEGCVFVDADYSQIELRVLAAESGDPKLIEAYRDARDIHATTAAEVFGVPLDEITPELRRRAKAVNFGIVYGISSFGLSEDLHISRQEAAEYIERYYETYPAIRDYLDGLVATAKETGYVETHFGRRRPMPELRASNFMQRQFGERVARNAPIQGTAADIIKIAMLRVADRLQKEGLASRLILQVHDELLIEARKEEVGTVRAILQEEMTGAADLPVALEIDVHEGETWYDAK